MRNYFDKDDMNKIELFNKLSGMRHRTKPFDMNNIDDLKEVLKFSISEYLDYRQYSSTLDDLTQNFDESLEYFDPATWINLTDDASKCDNLGLQAISSLNKTERVFSKLTDRAETKLREILNAILSANQSVQTEVFGAYYQFQDKLIDEIFEDIYELEYEYNMEDAFQAFIGYVNKKLAK